jgi:hypothetical protein
MNPIKELASVIDLRITDKANNALSGVPCELGTLTATGLKLDNFKHEIQDYLIADWLVKLQFPAFSFIGTETRPVDQQGNELPGASTSSLTRFDFNAKVVDGVRLELKPKLQAGDRVLAVPVNGGQDTVIIAKVVS